jgi:hypothetical protein
VVALRCALSAPASRRNVRSLVNNISNDGPKTMGLN